MQQMDLLDFRRLTDVSRTAADLAFDIGIGTITFYHGLHHKRIEN
jgi:hypothetical protein